MTFVVRAAEDDWCGVRELRLRALADAPDAFAATLAGERDQPEAFWRARLASPRAVTLVATDGGAHVGLIVVADVDDETAGIYAVWVAPAARGRGVGDALLAAAIDEARRRGRARAVLDVGVANAPARALYRRHGFAPTGRRSCLPAPREHVEEEELALDLGSAAAPV